MEQVKLYDTTLRDGMGGPGMSLSVEEKLKVVDALDDLGAHFIEAGFPSSNPKEAELFERLEDLSLENATIAAFGMTRRRDTKPEDDEALRTIVECFAPVACLVGKSWGLHLEKVIRVSPEENLAMIADSVAFCREQGKRVVFDAEHFFDGYRDDPGYAIECAARRGRRRRRERHPLRHQRRQPARVRRRRDRGGGRRARRRGRGRHPHPQRRRVRGRQLTGRGRGRRPPRPGHRQRIRRALRQRQPRLDPAGAAAEDGVRGRHRRAAREPDPDRPLPRRALQRDPRRRRPLRRPQRVRPQGRDARGRASPPMPAPSSTSTRRRSATLATSSPRSSPARRRSGPRPSGPGSRSTRRRPVAPSPASRSASTAATTTRRRPPPSSCSSARRPAATTRCSSSRASG